MTDNITLPRAVVERLRNVLRELASEYPPGTGLISPEERTALAALDAALAEPESKTPAWWMDGLTATLMREGVNKHRAREIAVGYWEAYCQIPGNEEDKP
jgi:hypothetical protein